MPVNSQFSTVLHKKSNIAGAIPALTSLSAGELAMNVYDGKLFIKTIGEQIKTFSSDDDVILQTNFTLDATLSGNWQSTYTTVQAKSATEWDNALANSYTQTNFFPLTGGTITGNISATGVISASASNVRINVINSSASRTFTDDDNNRVVHIDTTTTSLCAIFPSSLSDGFNVAIMNTGTNNLVLSSAQLNSAGTIIATRYGGAFVYKDSNNLFAVGRLV